MLAREQFFLNKNCSRFRCLMFNVNTFEKLMGVMFEINLKKSSVSTEKEY